MIPTSASSVFFYVKYGESQTLTDQSMTCSDELQVSMLTLSSLTSFTVDLKKYNSILDTVEMSVSFENCEIRNQISGQFNVCE